MENEMSRTNTNGFRNFASRSERFFRYAGFPLLLGIIIVALIPGLPAVGYLGLVMVVLIGSWLERKVPYESERRAEPHAFRQNTIYNIITLLVGPSLGVMMSWIFSRIDLPGANLSFLDPEAQLAAALVASGFLPYLLHRLSHEKDGFLWRAHSIHHAPRSVYWFNALRLHPLNTAWNTAAGLLPLLVLGFSPNIVFAAGLLNNFMSIVNHLNADLRLGPMNLIFNSGELHRWHHNRDLGIANHNYSSGLLIFWDLLLDTYLLPERKQKNMEVGLSEESDYPMDSVAEQLMHPFRSWATCCRSPGLTA